MSEQDEEVTEQDLAVVGDTNPQPGDESRLTDRTQSYFLDDPQTLQEVDSQAYVAETLDDSQFTGPQEG